MSVEITTAMVDQFGPTVELLSQQMESRLENAVQVERGIVGESKYFDQIGKGEAKTKTSRHADTQYMDTPHGRRRVTLTYKYYADLLDTDDKKRVLINPVNGYSRAAAAALNRSRDSAIITAGLGTSYTGRTGATAVSLPSSQKVPVNASGLTKAKLILAKGKFARAEVDKSVKLHFACTQTQIEDMLNDTEMTSADYNTVKLLVEGDVKTFMGFTFHQIELFGKDSNGDRQAMAWAETGIKLGIGLNVEHTIDRIPTKHNSIQVYAANMVGATRMEEEQVVEIACQEP